MDDPVWLKLLLVSVQGAVGAASALIAVFLTQRSALMERKQRMLQELHEPFFLAHQQVFMHLIDLQDTMKASNYRHGTALEACLDGLVLVLRKQLILLDDSVANSVIDVIEQVRAGIKQSGKVDTRVDSLIAECQRSLRKAVGVPDFVALVRTLVTPDRRR